MNIQGIHHVAYRCINAKQTVEFYQQVLNMDFQLAIAEDKVPSTGEPDPYMHVFMDAGNGNVLAFFEIPNSPDMGFDPNTPQWVQHIAFKVADIDALLAAKARVESAAPVPLEIETEALQPDADGRAALWRVRITMPPGASPGFVSGDVVFVLDEPVGGVGPDGASTELRVRLSGQVVEG